MSAGGRNIRYTPAEIPTETRYALTPTQHETKFNAKYSFFSSLLDELSAARHRLGAHIIDDDFFERSHAECQATAPWCDTPIQFLRDELFVAAISLHKAFIDAAAKPLKHNVASLMGNFNRNKPTRR